MSRVDSPETQPTTSPSPAGEPRPARIARQRRWPGWLAFVLLCAAGYALYHWRGPITAKLFTGNKPAAAPGSRAVPVIGAAARRGDLPIYLTGLGTVTAFNSVTVRTRVDGQLIKVAFVEGQLVQEGDLLAEIDPRPFQVQLTQAQGQLARDEALLKNARLDLARYQNLSKGAYTQQQYDIAVAAQAQYEGAIKSDQGQIDAANLQLTYCRITAPLGGRIGLRMVDQGNIVHAGDASGLALITQLQPISVVFTLAEDSLQQVLNAGTNGQSLQVEAFDRDLRNRLAEGRLMAIDNQIDTTTATARFKGIFENRDNRLFPNQFVNIRLLVDTRKAAVLVPSTAIQRSPATTFAYVVKPDDKVEMRPIKVGPTESSVTVIEEGVDAGEIVVTDGVDKLQPGSAVTVRRSDLVESRPASGPATRDAGGQGAGHPQREHP